MTSSILTYTGKWFDVLKPDPELIDLRDIAAALSKLCRFGGHCRQFYSVAEHSLIASQWMSQRTNGDSTLSAWALLHDASEAYMVDIPRPVKRQLQEYVRLEDAIQEAIAERFSFPWPMPKEVHEVDGDLLALELRSYMPAQPTEKLPPLPLIELGGGLPGNTLWPDQAEAEFLKHAKSLQLK